MKQNAGRSDVWRMIVIYHTSALQECTSQTEGCIHKFTWAHFVVDAHTTQQSYLEGKLERVASEWL